MSQAVNTAAPQPSTHKRAEERTPKLRLVVPEFPSRRTSFPGLCIFTAALGLALILLVNISINHTTFRVQQLTTKRQQLTDERDRLAEDLSYRMSPQNIESAAKQQGLKPAKDVKFVLEDGTIVDAPSGEGTVSGTRVPGPRSDTRDDIKPNLKSDERLPVVGGSSGSLTPPTLQQPK